METINMETFIMSPLHVVVVTGGSVTNPISFRNEKLQFSCEKLVAEDYAKAGEACKNGTEYADESRTISVENGRVELIAESRGGVAKLILPAVVCEDAFLNAYEELTELEETDPGLLKYRNKERKSAR